MSERQEVDAETRELIEGFLLEGTDNLNMVAQSLETWQANSGEADGGKKDEIIKEIFRGVHSVKGAAGMFSFTELAEFAHKFESVLDQIRNGEISTRNVDLDLLVECTDRLLRLLEVSCSQALANGELRSVFNEGDVTTLQRLNVVLESKTQQQELHEPPAQAHDAAPAAESAPAARTSDDSMRIDRRAIDKIFNLSGELLVASNNLELMKKRIAGANLADSAQILETIDKVTFLSKQLQNNIMSARMVSVKTVFQKIPRIAREISKKLEKKIELQFTGEDTRIDKAIAEQLMDPIVHLLRNAMDHGLETTAERIVKGKSESGNIHVSARFDSGVVLIQIQDDGRGIDPNIILSKAIAKGLAKEEDRQRLTTQQIYDFLFQAGFSTAEKLSDISGRGVGLDVVRTNLLSLGGKIGIESGVGTGTTFTLALPLTTGIKDSLIVEAGGELYAVPIEQVLETVKIPRSSLFSIAGRSAMRFREEIIGVKSLAEILDIKQSEKPCVPSEMVTALVFGNSEQKLGLIVSEIASKQQVLLKPIPASFRNNPMIQASTYLANGEAILILDPISYISSCRMRVSA